MLENAQAELHGETKATVFNSTPIIEKGEPIDFVWRDVENPRCAWPDGEFGRMTDETPAAMSRGETSIWLNIASAAARVQRTASPPSQFSCCATSCGTSFPPRS